MEDVIYSTDKGHKAAIWDRDKERQTNLKMGKSSEQIYHKIKYQKDNKNMKRRTNS